MTKTPKDAYLDILVNNLDLSELPEDALAFLVRYLTSPSATTKVSILLKEISRLYNRLDFQGHYEHVGYKASNTE